MAGRGDIKAGRAFVELSLKDSLTKGLRAASTKLKDFGQGATAVGGMLAGAGAAVLAPMAAAVKSLLDTGDALDKMRQRTGISVESLSELDHAAGQSGATLEDLENGVRKMQREIGKAGEQSKETTDALSALGLSADALAAMSPEEQFNTLAKAVGDVNDPTKRAALAMQFFGKSGTKLLPMIEDLDALRQEARDMGFTMSGETAAASVKLGDMLANLMKTVQFAGMAIAETLLPPIQIGVTLFQQIASAGMKWIKENRQLFLTIAAIGTGLLVAGAAVAAFGAAVTAAGFVLGGIATAITALVTVLGVVLSPLGLIVGALVAGGFAWAKWTTSGQQAVGAVMDAVGPLLKTFRDAFGGISDALMSGDLSLAGAIAMTGLKLVFLQGMAAITGGFGDFTGTLAQQILSGDFSGAWETAVSGMANLWAELSEGMVAVFTTAMRAVTDAWQRTTSAISDWILKNASEGGLLGKLAMLGSGVDFEATAKQARELNAQLAAKGLNAGGDPLAEAQQFARDDLGAQADAFRFKLDEMDRAAQARTGAARENLRNKTAGGANASNAAIDAAQADLARLIEDARKAKEAVDAKNAEDRQAAEDAAGGGGNEPGKLSKQVAGTFSAAAAQSLGTGGGPMERMAKLTAEQFKEAKLHRKIAFDTLMELRRGGVLK